MSIDFTSMTKEIVDGYRGKFSILAARFSGVQRIHRELTKNEEMMVAAAHDPKQNFR